MMESTIMHCLIYCTTTLVIIFSLFYAYAKYKLSYWSRRGVKTPPTHWFFGNFKESILLQKQPHVLMREIYNSADPDDPYIGFYIFHKPMLLLRDHDLIKNVMIKQFDVFPNRRFGSSTGRDTMGLVNLLAVATQPTWKYLRGKMTPALTGQKLKNMIPLIMECRKPLLNFIDKLPADESGRKKSKDILDISSRCISDILASLCFGVNTNSFEQEHGDFWQASLKIFRGLKRGIVFIIYFFVPDLIPFIEWYAIKPVNFFRECFYDSMNFREKTGNKRGDIMDSLLMLKNGEQNPDFKLEGDNLLAQSIAFYVAGFEATGTSTAFVMAQLARKPEYQDILYDEIETHLSGKKITMELINEMPFLDCVINESLRINPPLPVTDRIAERDYELPGTGLVIEKGYSVYVSVSGTNQDPKYFSDPLEFIPLRSKREKQEQQKFYESLTFGIGPRSCIGQRLAILMMKLVIITIISNYSLSYEEKKENIYPLNVFTYTSSQNVCFKKRDKSINQI